MVKRATSALVVAMAAALLFSATATAQTGSQAGVEHLHFAAGPFLITPGANLILLDSNRVPEAVGRRLHGPDGAEPQVRAAERQVLRRVPLTNVIHLHHGVWLSNGTAGEGEGNGTSAASTRSWPRARRRRSTTLPTGYGYPIGAKDFWVLNYMIHNLTARTAKVYITYDIDFVPADYAGGRPHHARPSDLDGRRGPPHLPGVQRQAGAAARTASSRSRTWPRIRTAAGPPLNVFTVDHAGTLHRDRRPRPSRRSL